MKGLTLNSWRFASLTLLLVTACSTPYYISHDFKTRTATHQTVAILPVEVIFSGRIPADLSERDLKTIREGEAKAFQISLYNDILRSTKSGKDPIRVNLQHYSRTLDIMADHGMDLDESFRYDPSELAYMLGVDAVVKSRVETMRFLTDLESYGIEMSIRITEILTNFSLYPWLPPNATRAKSVRADFSLLDGADSATLWNFSFDVDADWRSPAEEIIEGITRKAAKSFPYRR